MPSRILIIGVDPFLSKRIALAFDEASFDVVDVPNFREALLKLDQFKPDMVIMDMALPGVDGMEAYHHFHSTIGIPVVLLGEADGEEVWGRVMEVKADSYLVKPFGYQELVARVKAILRRYKSA